MPLSWRALALPLLALPLLAPARPALSQPAAAEPVVRVLLQQAGELSLRAEGAVAVRLRDRQGRPLLERSASQPLLLRLRQGWVELLAPAVDGSGVPLAQGLPSTPLAAPELWIEPVANAVLETGAPAPALAVGPRRYRGRLQVLAGPEGLQLINHVPLESYLASVVGSEMPASWPQQALRAQAVAARTYALKGRRPAAAFDLQATVASQMYRGLEAETASTREAVQATRGQVLTYGSALIDAVFHSSSGGSTESSGDLWAQQLPYLVSVPDFDQDSPVRRWRQALDPQLLLKAFPETGGVSSIEVLSTTATGRVRQARVLGPAGALVLSGASLRSRLGLRSTWVRFELELPPAPVVAIGGGPAFVPPPPALTLATALPLPAADPAPALPLPQLVAVGRGFGHGIGMSQWGALAMARRGDSYPSILSHYYRGTQLRSYGELAFTAAAEPGSGRRVLSDGHAQVVATGPVQQP
ncbi:MAG: SpoIID/LytB domain-containing protein [Vulcanococcus sp.]